MLDVVSLVGVMPATETSVFQLPSSKGEGGEACGADAGEGADSFFDLLIERGQAGIVFFVADRAGIGLQAKHVLLVEAGVDI